MSKYLNLDEYPGFVAEINGEEIVRILPESTVTQTNGETISSLTATKWQLISTGFQRKVLESVANIPNGETRTYQEIATEAGSPKAFRAVGTALAKNPLPLIIPCHRVVRKNGDMGQYVFGTDMKKMLLEKESSQNT